MYPYDQQKNPPAPMVPIKVLPPAGVQVNPITISVLADTGADYTCLPINIFFLLNLLPNDIVKVQDATGSGQMNLYSVDIEFHNRLFPSCTIGELPSGAPAILGRDIMNAFRLEFNGPSHYLAVPYLAICSAHLRLWILRSVFVHDGCFYCVAWRADRRDMQDGKEATFFTLTDWGRPRTAPASRRMPARFKDMHNALPYWLSLKCLRHRYSLN